MHTMIEITTSILIGYFLGALSPAALLSKLKKKNLREHGTGNLGATNTMLVLGKGYGTLVMIFDIAKAFVSVKLAQLLFPDASLWGLLAGGASVVGHIYPCYLKFKGGKGLASFVGLVLGYDPVLFLILMAIGVVLMLIFNYGVALTLSAAALFPILEGLRSKDLAVSLICVAVSILIILQHIGVLRKVLQGEDTKIRDYIKNELFHRH